MAAGLFTHCHPIVTPLSVLLKHNEEEPEKRVGIRLLGIRLQAEVSIVSFDAPRAPRLGVSSGDQVPKLSFAGFFVGFP